MIEGNVTADHRFGFQPAEAKQGFVWSMRKPFAFDFGPAARFCPECCMVWSKADARDAEKFIEKCSSDALKARLSAIQIGGKARE